MSFLTFGCAIWVFNVIFNNTDSFQFKENRNKYKLNTPLHRFLNLSNPSSVSLASNAVLLKQLRSWSLSSRYPPAPADAFESVSDSGSGDPRQCGIHRPCGATKGAVGRR